MGEGRPYVYNRKNTQQLQLVSQMETNWTKHSFQNLCLIFNRSWDWTYVQQSGTLWLSMCLTPVFLGKYWDTTWIKTMITSCHVLPTSSIIIIPTFNVIQSNIIQQEHNGFNADINDYWALWMQRSKQAALKLPSFVLEYDGDGGGDGRLCSQRNIVK